jgi:hypothetical protein
MSKFNLETFYKDPKVGLVGIDKLHRRLKKLGVDINRKNLKSQLAEIETYTLNKQIKKPTTMRRIIVHKSDEQWQADLVEMDVPQGARRRITKAFDTF